MSKKVIFAGIAALCLRSPLAHAEDCMEPGECTVYEANRAPVSPGQEINGSLGG